MFTPGICVKKLFEHSRYKKKDIWKQAAWSFKHNIFNESHKTILEKLIQNLKFFLFHAKFIFKTPLIIVKISNIYMYIGYPKLLKPWKWISIIQYNCFPIIIRPIISLHWNHTVITIQHFFLVFTYYSTYKIYFDHAV